MAETTHEVEVPTQEAPRQDAPRREVPRQEARKQEGAREDASKQAQTRKPRPKAKTPANKAEAKAAKKAEAPHGMRSAVKRSERRSSGKPSVLDGKAQEEVVSHGLFGGLTVTMMIELAAPHTWVAAIMPVFFAICLCAADDGTVSALMAVVLLAISVLMQSFVNTFNDYMDFVAGTDTRENQDDPTDAVLVYNDVQPYGARNLAVAFLLLAFLLGIYVVLSAGWIPLAIAVVGAACAFLYSGGPRPISYLPIGEIVSGFVFGGLITLASYTALTGTLDWRVLLVSLPLMIGIALIMFTNNTCDIEKDRAAGRLTLSVSLGRKDSVILYRMLLALWVILVALLVVCFYPTGSLVLFFLLAAVPPIMGLVRNPFVHRTREAGMSAIVCANAILGLVYGAAVLMSGIVVLVA